MWFDFFSLQLNLSFELNKIQEVYFKYFKSALKSFVNFESYLKFLNPFKRQ